LLKQRPGMFARSLFANMLWFGPEETLAAFKEVVHLLPARLVVTLGMYAESYFEQGHKRMVKPLGGNALLIEPHYLVSLYMEDQLKEMVKEVQDLCKEVVATRFANAGAGSGSACILILCCFIFHCLSVIVAKRFRILPVPCRVHVSRWKEIRFDCLCNGERDFRHSIWIWT